MHYKVYLAVCLFKLKKKQVIVVAASFFHQKIYVPFGNILFTTEAHF